MMYCVIGENESKWHAKLDAESVMSVDAETSV